MEVKCHGLVGRIFGHNYERCQDYRREQPRVLTGAELANILFEDMGDVMRAAGAVTKTYHGHVCKRCGDVIMMKGDGK